MYECGPATLVLRHEKPDSVPRDVIQIQSKWRFVWARWDIPRHLAKSHDPNVLLKCLGREKKTDSGTNGKYEKRKSLQSQFEDRRKRKGRKKTILSAADFPETPGILSPPYAQSTALHLVIGSETSKHGGFCEEVEEMLSKGTLEAEDFGQRTVERNSLGEGPCDRASKETISEYDVGFAPNYSFIDERYPQGRATYMYQFILVAGVGKALLDSRVSIE
ncbi:hypothetical protein HZH68_007313 [Vespula germanica]|uniref:Uncharacterized protein n=1 Tax=Vespula germanica TaxID=30212 RepID=A0A834NBM3_VESGE|nr:hypothetical protein HZH68_007313 [Vespula germanica]